MARSTSFIYNKYYRQNLTKILHSPSTNLSKLSTIHHKLTPFAAIIYNNLLFCHKITNFALIMSANDISAINHSYYHISKY